MKYITLFFFLVIVCSNVLSQNIIKKSTYYFAINNDSLSGRGAEIIKSKISESQFFLIGEEHNDAQLENMVKLLIPFLKKNGFNNYVAEIGPLAAKKLTKLATQKDSIKSFNKKYSNYIIGSPFGFFGTKEEAKTLTQVVNNNIAIWGVDFENYNSYLYLLDLLLKNSSNSQYIKEKYHEIYNYTASEYKNGKNGFNPKLTEHLLKSEKLNNYLKAVSNKKNKEIIRELKRSLSIYADEGRGFWFPRVKNMKYNFVTHYKKIKNNESKKAFIKLGAMHVAKGTSYSGFQELGNTIYELANYNLSKSFSLICFPRYKLDSTNSIKDVIDEEDTEILKFTKPDKWTFINLNELEELSIEKNIKIDDTIKGYIQKFDAILIPPATKESEKNY
ncbi:hypothetical protein [Rhizosphaericola mali]|uniref:Uncharacterized protein n=1 Tax=Rhizosphaericola mali TaxID=2545455 RepID=A0A5P2G6U5_9BACT|nr:hypothetical protein [Rhizosphaericola mali]QES91047.1 hypothetical protein E0W69_020245 [Rhizosphaericola mali]